MQKNNELIELPKPKTDSKISIEEALKNRRSVRSFKSKSISLEDLAQILWAAYGLTKEVKDGPDHLRGGLRATPSAGALYPLEIYVVASNVKNLQPGVYRYVSSDHTLKRVQKDDKSDELGEAALNQPHVSNAPVNIVYSAVYERITQKYGERGKDRYIPMEVGHSGENVYLQAYSLDLGTCAVGAFNDNKVKKVIEMPAEEEPLYIMPVGYPK